MMKPLLYRLVEGGFEAAIEETEGNVRVTIGAWRTKDPSTACRSAARLLRAAAARFEKLALQNDLANDLDLVEGLKQSRTGRPGAQLLASGH